MFQNCYFTLYTNTYQKQTYQEQPQVLFKPKPTKGIGNINEGLLLLSFLLDPLLALAQKNCIKNCSGVSPQKTLFETIFKMFNVKSNKSL